MKKLIIGPKQMLEILRFCPEDTFDGCAKLFIFVEWRSTPPALRRPKSKKAFAKLMKVKQNTLTRWRKRLIAAKKQNKHENKNQK